MTSRLVMGEKFRIPCLLYVSASSFLASLHFPLACLVPPFLPCFLHCLFLFNPFFLPSFLASFTACLASSLFDSSLLHSVSSFYLSLLRFFLSSFFLLSLPPSLLSIAYHTIRGGVDRLLPHEIAAVPEPITRGPPRYYTTTLPKKEKASDFHFLE